MNQILVTGATGLLGSSLVPHLKESGHKVVTHARSTQADFIVDLSDRVKTGEMLTGVQPRLIINLVGLTNVDQCEEQVKYAYLANTSSVENLVSWIQETDANCHLVQVSTDQVYDSVGLNTEDQINITNSYALSKYAGELAAVRVPSTVLRVNFVGRSNVSHRESLTDWAYKSLRSAKYVEVLDDVYFSPLSITTLVQIIQMVVQRKPMGIYNLGSHDGMSKADFIFTFAKCLGLPTNNIRRIYAAHATFLKAYRPRDMRMDSSKFENTLGIKLPELADEIIRIGKEYDEFL